MANSDSEKVSIPKDKYAGKTISEILKEGAKFEWVGRSGGRDVYRGSVGPDTILFLVDPLTRIIYRSHPADDKFL